MVGPFLRRPLDGGPYPYLWLDALTQKVREDGRIVNFSVAVATAVNGEGKREVLGIDVETSEDGAFWLAFLRGTPFLTHLRSQHPGRPPESTSPA